MMTVTKELKFEAAHRLVNDYPGKCRNNHGHSWVVFITVGLRDGASLNSYGFVKDYGDFAPLRKWIDNNLDHATMVSNEDTSFIKWLEENEQRHFVTEGNPTSETLAKIIFEKAAKLLDDYDCLVKEVRIKETCTSECCYSK